MGTRKNQKDGKMYQGRVSCNKCGYERSYVLSHNNKYRINCCMDACDNRTPLMDSKEAAIAEWNKLNDVAMIRHVRMALTDNYPLEFDLSVSDKGRMALLKFLEQFSPLDMENKKLSKEEVEIMHQIITTLR